MLQLVDFEGASARIDDVFALLRALGIAQLVYSLNGGGDSGEASLATIEWQDKRDDLKLPKVPIAIGRGGDSITLNAFLEDFAANAPDGDWVNNEGGYGTVTFLPFEEGGTFYDDMNYREDGDYGDDDDDSWFEGVETFGTNGEGDEDQSQYAAPVVDFGEVRS